MDQDTSVFYIFYDKLRLDKLREYLLTQNFKIVETLPTTVTQNREGATRAFKPLNEEKIEVYRHFIA